jgi:hypothetical protein
VELLVFVHFCPLQYSHEVVKSTAVLNHTTHTASRPIGQPTRGKTARHRLRRVDTFFLLYEDVLFRRCEGVYTSAFFVDLGYGAEPHTTLESAQRLRRLNAGLPVLGVEIDPERVAAAAPFQDEHTHFRVGGFNLPLQPHESVRAIRAFNVLRQYSPEAVTESLNLLGEQLLPGGLLIEGTSDPLGRIWVANILRRTGQGLKQEGLLFSTNFRWGFEPGIFQPVLPKNYIHCMLPGEPIHSFMEAWKAAARQTMSIKNFGLRQWFTASAHALAESGYDIELRRRFLNKGFLFWKVGEMVG